jgi:DNA-binding CsgD family transcriptional regulator
MRTFEDTLLAVYRAAREETNERFQDIGLGVLRGQVPFDSGRWATGNATAHGVVFDTVHLVDEFPDWKNAYVEISPFDHAAKFVVTHQGMTGNFHFGSYFAGPANLAMRDYTRRYRHETALITCNGEGNSGLLFNISVFRANPDDLFSEQERAFVQTIYPHLTEAWKINQALHMERARSGHSPARWSVAICTPGGNILLAEPVFIEALCAAWPVSQRPADTLPAPVLAALQSGLPQYKGEQHVYRFERKHELALVRARPRVPLDGLSARELNVARLVCAGHSHKEVARLLGIAPATVRNHLQAIHDRAHIHTNTDLVVQMSAVDF